MWSKKKDLTPKQQEIISERTIHEIVTGTLKNQLVNISLDDPEVDFYEIPRDKIEELFTISKDRIKLNGECLKDISKAICEYLREEIPKQIPEKYMSFISNDILPDREKSNIVSLLIISTRI